jgi:hypothetical protein
MRLIVLWLGHGKTKKDRFGFGGSGSIGSGAGGRCQRIARGPSRSVARLGSDDAKGHGQGAWGWPCDGGSPATAVPATKGRSQATRAALGRTAADAHATGRRAGVFGGLEAQSRAGPVGGGDAATGCFGTRVGSPSKAVGGLPLAGATPLAQGGPRHTTSESGDVGPGGVEKKRYPKSWRPC